MQRIPDARSPKAAYGVVQTDDFLNIRRKCYFEEAARVRDEIRRLEATQLGVVPRVRAVPVRGSGQAYAREGRSLLRKKKSRKRRRGR